MPEYIANWLKGLISAVIGGAANAFTASWISPETFNLDEGLPKLLQMAAAGAVLAAGAYLKQSPLPVKPSPDDQWNLKGSVRLPLLIGLFLLCVSIVSFSGCAPKQSALLQMQQQSSDPVKLAKAAYLDMLSLYINTGRIFLKYKGRIETERPEAVYKIKIILNKMKNKLDAWKELSGLARLAQIEDGSEEFHALRRQLLFELADYIEERGEK